MKKFKKLVASLLAVSSMALCVSGISANADEQLNDDLVSITTDDGVQARTVLTYNYTDITGITLVGSYKNTNANAHTIGLNTRPTRGTSGVIVYVKTSSGSIVASKTFPYYSSTSNLSVSIPGGTTYYIYVEPKDSVARGTVTLTE